MSVPHVRRRFAPKIGSIPSPCVQVCRLDDDGFCIGCKRTIDEIREWCIMSEYEQEKLLYELKWRKENHND